MRDFVMFFNEKEGTSATLRLLDKFAQVDVVRRADSVGGWEPFDTHNCGPMPTRSLLRCVDLLFSGAPITAVNEVYVRTATGPLVEVGHDRSIGFKMRFQPPREPPIPSWLPGSYRLRRPWRTTFARGMTGVLREHGVLVLMAVRQDLFRWALSKYHGDGTTRPGHIQFRLARGELQRSEIPRVTVDPSALERTIQVCESTHSRKRRIAQRLQDAGVDVVPVRYEDLLTDDVAFFRDLLSTLGHDVPVEEISDRLAEGSGLERVHGDDLSEFFVNADELVARFGDRIQTWD